MDEMTYFDTEYQSAFHNTNMLQDDTEDRVTTLF